MPLRTNTRIYIKQMGYDSSQARGFKPREAQFYFDLCEAIEVKHSWENIAKTATVKLPRRMQVLFYGNEVVTDHTENNVIKNPNISGDLVPEPSGAIDSLPADKFQDYLVNYVQNLGSSAPVNKTSFEASNLPLIQRGDCIRIDAGYDLQKDTGDTVDLTSNVFFGYVSGVTVGDMDIKIECEDYTFLLRQVRLNASTFHTIGNPLSGQAKGNYEMVDGGGSKALTGLPFDGSVGSMINVLAKTGVLTKSLSKISIPLRMFDAAFDISNWISEYEIGVFDPAIDVSANQPFWMGDWNIENTASLYDVLEKLSSEYGLHPYFPDLGAYSVGEQVSGIVQQKDVINPDGTTTFDDWTNLVNYKLNLGTQVYNPCIRPANLFTFNFQQNIISSNLEYKRKDDIVAGAYVKGWTKTLCDKNGDPVENVADAKLVIKNVPDGIVYKAHRTQTRGAAVTVGDLGGIMYTFMYTNQMGTTSKNYSGSPVPVSQVPAGSTIIGKNGKPALIPNKATYDAMRKFGQAQLNKYHYSGYKGSFTTFGYPFVRVGDLVNITDNLFAERNGVYVVKGVKYTITPDGGARQEITVDYRAGDDINDTRLQSYTSCTFWQNNL